MNGPERQRGRVVCVGNATVDRTFALDGAVQLGTKNPAVARPVAFGGVARNVAENLVRLDVGVVLVSGVGDDDAGRSVLADCRRLGIDVAGCIVGPGPTSQYLAVLDSRNDLVLGASDMRAIEALTIAMLRPALTAAVADWMFAECNLSPATLGEVIGLRRPAGQRLAVDAVSTAKARRLPRSLHGVDVLFCNAVEARAYLEREHGTDAELAQALCGRGAQTAVMTLGPSGAIIAGPHGVERLAAVRAAVADVTGAGDGLIAGTLYGLLDGLHTSAAVRVGMTVAALALESVTPVHPDLSPATVRSRRA